MPTLPRSADREPHRERAVAESFGNDAERYDRARPSYPAELVTAILAASPGPDVLDVGCGTGIATEQFRAAGASVLGIEVDERMATLARRRGFDVEVSGFENWDPVGRTFDAVVAGQAWHWIDPVAGAAKAASALCPGGLLALFWNVFQPAPDLARALAEAYQRVLPDMPVNLWAGDPLAMYTALVDKVSDGIRQTGAFGEPGRLRFDWAREYTRDEWVDQIATFGGHNQIPPDTLTRLQAEVGAAVDDTFTMGYAALAVTAVRGQRRAAACGAPGGGRPRRRPATR